ncbi:MAG: TonB-dependent receptor [Hydrocarboniphaga sp.]|uniref:TonB-dependent receptor n=1 Tax=Hydrocarboniphaga sp. TaxID=2033016 RepID=UPI002618EB31|nr:TonB-dependent receptor [Hydrocarboniphaga sp.]MDB5969732.1 TonB-dependent receptor [Hydrocarboniphaga sp.]
MSSSDRRRRRASGLLLLPLLITPAWAQTTADAPPEAALESIPVPAQQQPEVAPPRSADTEAPVLMDEVIVTARKREERLQDVPVSVSAFSAEQLDARGIVDVRDLGIAVPGLQFTDLAGYNLIYIRGIGTDAFIPSADPSVATYLDGVYFPSAHSMAQSFGALERIEVLKGPQGTLFGRNSTGGAVMLWTKDPGAVAETSIQASYAPRFEDSKTRVYTNVPLGENFAFSVSGFYNRADNYYRLDNGSGDTLPPEINKGGRIKIGFYPSENLQIVLSGMLMQQSGTSTTTSANTDPSGLGLTIPAETRDYVVTANSKPSLITDTRAWYGKINWQNPGVDVKLLGSYYYTNAHDYVYDFDGSSQPIATYGADSDYQRIVTSELQFTSNAESWGSSWLKWVGGLYYLKSEGGYKPGYLRLLDSVNLPLADVVNGVLDSLPPAVGDPLRDALSGVILPSSLTFYFNGLVDAESYSAYAQTTASATDWLDLTLGGRYQRETRQLKDSNFSIGNLGGGDTTLIPWSDQSSTVNNFSPKASIEIRPLKDVLLYTSYTKGFKSATYNIINIYTPPDYVKPEEVTSYEAGFKSEWFNRSLRFNAAAFQNDIKNLQTGFVSFTSGGAINFENAGKARIRGVEVDTIWQPLRVWDPGLVISGGATWLKAIYTDYDSGHYFTDAGFAAKSDCSNPDGPRCNSFDGNRIVRTPKFSATGSISQSFDVPGGKLDIAGDYYYNSGYYYLAQNSANSFEPHYDLIGAHISYLYEPWSFRVTVFGENLGDERYDLAQFHTDFGREDTLAPPVTYGVRLNLDF